MLDVHEVTGSIPVAPTMLSVHNANVLWTLSFYIFNLPDIRMSESKLGFGPIQNYAFSDGNKRIGTHAMLVFPAQRRVSLFLQKKRDAWYNKP